MICGVCFEFRSVVCLLWAERIPSAGLRGPALRATRATNMEQRTAGRTRISSREQVARTGPGPNPLRRGLTGSAATHAGVGAPRATPPAYLKYAPLRTYAY